MGVQVETDEFTIIYNAFYKYTLNEVIVMIKDDHEAVSADIFVTPTSDDDVSAKYSEDDDHFDQPTAPKRKKC